MGAIGSWDVRVKCHHDESHSKFCQSKMDFHLKRAPQRIAIHLAPQLTYHVQMPSIGGGVRLDDAQSMINWGVHDLHVSILFFFFYL